MNPQFEATAQTFFGLERIVAGRVEMLTHMMHAVSDLRDNGFVRNVVKRRTAGRPVSYQVDYPYAFMADTFFSDTLFATEWVQILSAVKEHGVPCRIIFLNPFSDQARVRAMMLGAEDAKASEEDGRPLTALQERALKASQCWTEIERNRRRRGEELDAMLPITLRRTLAGLENLRQGMKGAAVAARAVADAGATPPSDDREVRQQLEAVLKQMTVLSGQLKRQGLDVEVRFTSDLLLLPIYILGPYVYRGFLMPRSSAVSKPWSIYRDDPSRSDDMFELTREAFEQAWQVAVSLEEMAAILNEDNASKKRGVMIAYSEDNRWALDQVATAIDALKRNVVVQSFPKAEASGDVPRDTVLRMLETCSAGIVLLLSDEKLGSVQQARQEGTVTVDINRSRPNVIYEMGMMHGRFQFERVLLIMEQDSQAYERPSNIAGLSEARIRIDSHRRRLDDSQLRGALLAYFEQVGL